MPRSLARYPCGSRMIFSAYVRMRNPLQRGEHREDEQRQVVVDQAHGHGVLGVEDVDAQVLGQVSVRVEDDLQRVRADEERRPERHDDEEQRQHLVRAQVAGHPVGHRVADRDRQHGAEPGHHQGAPEDVEVEGRGDLAVLGGVEAVLEAAEALLGRQRERNQDGHRPEEEDRVVQQGRRGKPRGVVRPERALPPGGGRGGRHVRRLLGDRHQAALNSE